MCVDVIIHEVEYESFTSSVNKPHHLTKSNCSFQTCILVYKYIYLIGIGHFGHFPVASLFLTRREW